MKRLLIAAASATILIIAPEFARPGSLYDAVLTGDFQKVSRWVARGEPDDVGELGTALHAAIARGDLELAILLIDHEASLEASRNAWGMRPLHRAVNYKSPEFVSLLLDRGAKVDARDSLGRTPPDRRAPWRR